MPITESETSVTITEWIDFREVFFSVEEEAASEMNVSLSTLCTLTLIVSIKGTMGGSFRIYGPVY